MPPQPGDQPGGAGLRVGQGRVQRLGLLDQGRQARAGLLGAGGADGLGRPRRRAGCGPRPAVAGSWPFLDRVRSWVLLVVSVRVATRPSPPVGRARLDAGHARRPARAPSRRSAAARRRPRRVPADERRLDAGEADLGEAQPQRPLQERAVGAEADRRAGVARPAEHQLGDLVAAGPARSPARPPCRSGPRSPGC